LDATQTSLEGENSSNHSRNKYQDIEFEWPLIKTWNLTAITWGTIRGLWHISIFAFISSPVIVIQTLA
jgi:hypothetical protein